MEVPDGLMVSPADVFCQDLDHTYRTAGFKEHLLMTASGLQ